MTDKEPENKNKDAWRISESAKELYERIQAPETLKARVEQMAASSESAKPVTVHTSFWRKKAAGAVYTLAACAAAVAIFFTSHIQTPDAPVVLVGDENPALAAVDVENGMKGRAGISVYALDAPDTETVSLVLTLETDIKTEVSVSHGFLSDMLSGEPKKTLAVSEDAKLFWDIEDISPDETAYLTVKNAKTGETYSEYSVAKDEESGTWFIRLKENED